jgi:MFS family permease
MAMGVTFGRRLTDGVTMFVVTGLSLLLLVYVGFGEGKRIYEQFQIEKLTAHNRIVQNAMENYLRAGLPLKQYAGFSTLADPIVQSIDEIDTMVVFDQAGHQLFIVTDKDKKNPKLPDPAEVARQVKQSVEVERGESYYQVVVPLRTRFLAVFLEHLTYSFLPKFMQEAASASELSLAFAAAPFTAYYLCFALSLIPAGHFSERFGAKPMIWPGLILASLSILGLILPLGIIPLTVLRGLSGIGQGMLFIGVQAYILAVASPEKKTQGNAIIVFGFQGGMISGMAIGSLLVSYLHPEGVFVVSAAIGLATALYSLMLIPKDTRHKHLGRGLAAAIQQVGSDLKRVMRSGEFLKTMFCIGIPAKAILTGTITFALPLLLGQYGYRQEEIGQIIMLYGIGVVAASGYVARLVDRTGNTEMVLFWGAAISGMGLVLVGLMGSEMLGNGPFSTVVVIGGVLIVGLAHGFVNAPVVTHVAHSQLARQIGATSVTTTYRFLERIGHVAGPFIVGQLFLVWGQSGQILVWIGIATAALGLVFLIRTAPPPVSAIGPEPAR